MTDRPDDPGEREFEAELDRVERELGEHFEEGRERAESGPLFTGPPHPGPMPEILREPPRQPAPEKPPSLMSGISGLGAAWGMAFEFIVTILTGLALGWLLDRWLSSAPWGILAGLALGFIAAFIRIIRQTQLAERAEAKARDAARRP